MSANFDFTNVKCTTLDPGFSEFEYCYLKSINRTYKYVSLKCNLFQIPVKKVKVSLALYKRYNGYRPFMFNVTFDACRFLNNKKGNPMVYWFYQFLETYSNMDHPCPFNHSLELFKLPASFVNHHATQVLPFPEGDYMLDTTWIAYDVPRAVAKFYGTLS
ncbi:hypothetical protein KR018_004545 [Drosophila ironensis]|nr:hypothetical protein KR018_004545 [Drosophila ironensis]